MDLYASHLQWIDAQQARMVELVTQWARINSGSTHLAGLGRMADRAADDFAVLGGQMQRLDLPSMQKIDVQGNEIQLPLGQAIAIRKARPGGVRVFLSIHMDTVYGVDHPFQKVQTADKCRAVGPGVADAKGGLCVMLVALEALERSPFSAGIDWQVLINPDEELGSPGSAGLLRQYAAENQIGMIYEPALADGRLVGERKGSGNFDCVIHGKSAHAGRDFAAGRNAVCAAAQLVSALEKLSDLKKGVTVNPAKIDGGGPNNIVPELAVVRFNVRVPTPELQREMEGQIQRVMGEVAARDGIQVKLHGGFGAPPRVMDDRTVYLYKQLAECGDQLGMNLSWTSSGGASDGNKLAAAGLPVIDTLGPCGGNLHSPEEFVILPTLAERAKLSALLLMKLASGEISR